jgi:hypothetical protein
METIEERAREYAHQYRRDAHDLKGERADAAFAAYCQGAEDEREELIRWHDPKCPPAHRKPVLIKGVTPSGRKCLVVGVFYKSGLQTNTYYKVDPIGWREIHE